MRAKGHIELYCRFSKKVDSHKKTLTVAGNVNDIGTHVVHSLADRCTARADFSITDSRGIRVVR